MRTVTALAALSSLAILVPSLAVGFPDEPAGPKARPIKILASPSILQPGTPCRVEVDEQPPTVYRTVVTTYEGTVVEADDEGIRLDVREVRRVNAVPAVSKVPFSDRLFRNVGIGEARARREASPPRDRRREDPLGHGPPRRHPEGGPDRKARLRPAVPLEGGAESLTALTRQQRDIEETHREDGRLRSSLRPTPGSGGESFSCLLCVHLCSSVAIMPSSARGTSSNPPLPEAVRGLLIEGMARLLERPADLAAVMRLG